MRYLAINFHIISFKTNLRSKYYLKSRNSLNNLFLSECHRMFFLPPDELWWNNQKVMSKCRNSSNNLFLSECLWMFVLPSDEHLDGTTISAKTVCHNLNLPKCDRKFTDIVLKLPWYNDLNMILYQDLPRLFTRSKWQLLSKVSSGDVQLQFLQGVFKIYWTLQLPTKHKNWTKCDFLMLHSF